MITTTGRTRNDIYAEYENKRREADAQYRAELEPYNEARNERIEPYHQEYLAELREAWKDWRVEEKRIATKRHEILEVAKAERDKALMEIQPNLSQ